MEKNNQLIVSLPKNLTFWRGFLRLLACFSYLNIFNDFMNLDQKCIATWQLSLTFWLIPQHDKYDKHNNINNLSVGTEKAYIRVK